MCHRALRLLGGEGQRRFIIWERDPLNLDLFARDLYGDGSLFDNNALVNAHLAGNDDLLLRLQALLAQRNNLTKWSFYTWIPDIVSTIATHNANDIITPLVSPDDQDKLPRCQRLLIHLRLTLWYAQIL